MQAEVRVGLYVLPRGGESLGRENAISPGDRLYADYRPVTPGWRENVDFGILHPCAAGCEQCREPLPSAEITTAATDGGEGVICAGAGAVDETVRYSSELVGLGGLLDANASAESITEDTVFREVIQRAVAKKYGPVGELLVQFPGVQGADNTTTVRGRAFGICFTARGRSKADAAKQPWRRVYYEALGAWAAKG
eukprot:1240197-Rhodomonas_salina.1